MRPLPLLRRSLLLSLALALLGLGVATPARAASIVDPGFGLFAFSGGPGELSGLARVSGDGYYAVADSGGVLVELSISVDPATGEVLGAVPGTEVVLAGGVDLEGVVYDRTTGHVLVSDEVGPAIRRHDPASGALVGGVSVPAIFASARTNRSLESLARDPASGALWTANEDTLGPDGPIASFTAGGVVRLQRFTADGTPDGQWAYTTDRIPGGAAGGNQTSGVVELLVLPSGELLLLERTLSSIGFRSRIYQVDLAGATDVGGLASLAEGPFVPVTKTLLWQGGPMLSNLEGMALGPRLDDGSHSLLLIADDNGTFGQALYPLRVAFVPEPATAVLLATALGALAHARARTRAVQLRSALTQTPSSPTSI